MYSVLISIRTLVNIFYNIVFCFFFFPGKLSVNTISFDAQVLGFSPPAFMLLTEAGLHRQMAFEKL